MKYSILIPVLDSIRTLRHTIETCIRQEVIDDYEVVVSDNGSTDDIKGLVESFHDKHLRYYRNDVQGTQADSFNAAVSRAQGEYVFMLGGDDSISKWALYIADRILEITGEEILYWYPSRYFWPERDDYPNSLWMPENRAYKRVNSEDKLTEVFNGLNIVDAPMLYTCGMIKTEVLRNLQKRLDKYGMKLHEDPQGDNFQSIMTLLACEHYLEIPYSLVMRGQSKTGKKDNCKIGSEEMFEIYVSRKAQENLKDEPFFDGKSNWHCTDLYHTLSSVQRILKEENAPHIPEISYKNIIGMTIHQIIYEYEFLMMEGEEYQKIFNDALAYMESSVDRLNDPELKEWFENAFSNLKTAKVGDMSRRRNRLKIGSRINQVIHCDNLGITDIAEAQNLLDNLYLSKESIDNDMELFEYSYGKSRELAYKIRELDEKGSVAIYGIGSHTEVLLSVYKNFCGKFRHDVIYIDSDKNRRGTSFQGGKVYNPDDIPNLNLAGIVLSSVEFQEILYGNVRKYEDKVEIIRPYDVGDMYYLDVIGSQNCAVRVV